MLTLRAEIALCLIAVGLLGLLSGWMMHRARGRARLREAVTELKARHEEVEESLRRDADNLEERLQALGGENRSLNAENRRLRESPLGSEETLDTERTAAIEINRRQIETQEHLQRMIREREREIATLHARLLSGRTVGVDGGLGPANDESAPSPDGFDETVRIDPGLLPMALAAHASNERRDAGDPTHDDTLESTVDVAFLDGEEATVALDEETLSLVRGLPGSKLKH